MNTRERFFEKVWPEPNSGCWLWAAAANQQGYGMFNERWDNELKKSIVVLAHRFSFKMANKDFDGRLQVLHRCDNPACVNPDHLFAGLPADNVADMDRKGRRVNKPLTGSQHPNSKITETDVKRMFEMRQQGMTQKQIGDSFGISQVQVGNIIRKDQWKQI
jgi:hypothetical protein